MQSAFVNSNAANVSFVITNTDPKYMYEVFPERFAQMVQHDTIDEDADPVLVYVRAGKPVAWYDMECATGYIAD